MKNIVGILMGGYSTEYEISLKSGELVYNAIDPNLFTAYKVHILKRGWFVKDAQGEYAIDKNDFSFIKNDVKITFDVLFNAIHGTPGEDGILQGYLALLNLKHTSCLAFESALTFNKAKCNTLLRQLDVLCANSVFLVEGENGNPQKIVDYLGLPLFVKPNRAGSSFGISKVESAAKISSAIAKARKEDQEVLIESAVVGREFGCGVARLNGKVKSIAVTEIISERSFFDFEAKYLGASQEITPANISKDLENKMKEITEFAYNSLGLKGVVRTDFIVDDKNNEPYLIEINSVPGLSPESIVPQQIEYAGFTFTQFFTLLLQEALSNTITITSANSKTSAKK